MSVSIPADLLGAASPGSAGPRSLLPVGAALSVAGFAGIVVVSGLYAAAPVAAALPAQPLDLVAAVAGAVEGSGPMRAASLVGVVSDIIAAMGVLLVALEAARRGNGLVAAGWGGVLFSILVFTLVDTMVGFLLPPLALEAPTTAFVGIKRLFDALFLVGTFAFGCGAVLASAGERAMPCFGLSRAVTTAGLAVGLLAIVSAIGCFVGFPLHPAVGGSIGAGALTFAWISGGIARSALAARTQRK